MAIHTIVRINHDKAYLWERDPYFASNLYRALAGAFIPGVKKRILDNYGITVLKQHHSSDKFKVIPDLL